MLKRSTLPFSLCRFQDSLKIIILHLFFCKLELIGCFLKAKAVASHMNIKQEAVMLIYRITPSRTSKIERQSKDDPMVPDTMMKKLICTLSCNSFGSYPYQKNICPLLYLLMQPFVWLISFSLLELTLSVFSLQFSQKDGLLYRSYFQLIIDCVLEYFFQQEHQ